MGIEMRGASICGAEISRQLARSGICSSSYGSLGAALLSDGSSILAGQD